MKSKQSKKFDEIIDTLQEFELDPKKMLSIRGGDGPGSGPETDPDPPVIIVPEEG